MTDWNKYKDFIMDKQRKHEKLKREIFNLKVRNNNMYNNHCTITESLRKEIKELKTQLESINNGK